MNEMIKTQLNHRTIREFKACKVNQTDLENILNVINRTANSMGMQSFSVIRVTDRDLRKRLSKVTNQEYIIRVPELLIFIVDLYRNNEIAKEMGVEKSFGSDMDRFFQGFSDAILAAQNAINAIEAMDMGAVFFGSILNDPFKVVEILKLPKLTFPALGLGFGVPNQEPQLKPRMDLKLKVFENEYKTFDNYLEEIEEYDKEMKKYYDLRNTKKPLDAFSEQIADRFSKRDDLRANILDYIKEQGFQFK
ncbi:MAG: nitroreductase family protein [Tissierellia bacterium]|nr:nitroreductase family protein [Tissierellia bacterium]